MIRTHYAHILDCAISNLVRNKKIPSEIYADAELSDPRNPEHGDYSCNIALIAAKKAGISPRNFAELLQEELSAIPDFESIEVAGPGFINLRLKPEVTAKFLCDILSKGPQLAKSEVEEPFKIDVEFVSVNPNGPITVGSGRGAAFGDTLCRVLEAVGHQITREYYINDGVNSEQMRLFAESVLHYYREKLGISSSMPENGYKGEYVADVATELFEKYGSEGRDKDLAWFQNHSQDLMLERQQQDLIRFGVKFDVIFGEQTLHNAGTVLETLAELKERGVAYENEDALWLKSTDFGDDKDRVLVRADGRPTYIASDIAYHRNKFERGYDKVIDILGPDHHGYIGRLNASVASSGYSLDRFQIVIFQIVRFVKDGQPAPMRKRDGNIYELRDLMNDVGPDVARFFYLMRSHETHMDFDIDLATKKSDDNPVFYVQYAHARICSVMRKAAESGFAAPSDVSAYTHLLVHPKEGELIKKIADLSHEARRCSVDYGVHRLTTYAVELARTYHHFYDACRVIQPENPELTLARLALCEGAKVGLRATFDLLGISAPERMERAETVTAED
ncbi:MAG TPA: arginine--tRNA ligase [Fimbriimonadaceae bacterium]